MKYRIDFITNSSSSSSVLISFKKGNKEESFVSLDQEIYLRSIGDSAGSYQSLLNRLADFKMMEIIVDKKVPQSGDQWLTEISGSGDVYLPQDRIDEFKKKNPSSEIILYLDQLKALEKAKKVKVDDYKSFVNHPLWALMGVSEPSNISIIIENFNLSGDYNENIIAEINPKNLKVNVEIISSDDMDE